AGQQRVRLRLGGNRKLICIRKDAHLHRRSCGNGLWLVRIGDKSYRVDVSGIRNAIDIGVEQTRRCALRLPGCGLLQAKPGKNAVLTARRLARSESIYWMRA